MSSDQKAISSQEQTRARATLAKVRSGLDKGQLPVMGQVVALIREISEKADQMSAQDLAKAISSDPSTMSRILAIASTMGYNPGGAEITSISQAVIVIGFERIRNLAVSVLLLKNVDQQGGAETNREIAGLSLAGGLFAACLSKRIGGVEPDLAFLCGALRSYGRMLMSSFLQEEYEKAVEIASREGGVTDQAFRDQFGITPLQLGRELLSSMQLPQMILKTLQDIPEETRDQLGTTPTGSLMIAAELGLRMAETLATQAVTPEDFGARLAETTREYPKEYRLTSQDAADLLKDVVSQISSFAQAGNFSKGTVVLFQRMECLSEERTPPAPFKPKPKPIKTEPEALVGTKGASREVAAKPTMDAHRASTVLEAARKDLATMLASPKPNLHQAFALLIQSLQNALELESCLIFLREPGGAGFRMEQGIGGLTHELCAGALLRSGQRDVFAVPLGRGEDVMIQNPLEARMKAFIPDWLRPSGRPLPFILLPLKDTEGTYALLCGNTSCPNTLALAGQIHEDLRLLRADLSCIGTLIRSRQP